MILNELFQPSPIQDMTADQTQYKLSDTRKTKLTLGHINRLRKMHDMRTLEHQQEMKIVQRMYKMPAQADAGGLGF